ncbi:MAG: YncE family protein, partial [Desulfobaccales bacterium]
YSWLARDRRREETMRKILGAAALAAALGLAFGAQAQIIVSGNDEKAVYNDAGQMVVGPPGKDTVSIIDIRNRTQPRIVATLPLINTIVGPPTNLAVTPDEKLAIVVNSLDAVQDGDKWKTVPDDRVFVIDLTAKPPAIIATLHAGKQASGMAINRAGTLALIANRADNTVSVLTISGKDVKVVGSVALAPAGAPSQQLSAVAITPDGKRALVVKATANKAALLDIDGTTVTYKGYDMITGVFPYNVQITPDGKLGLVNNNGNAGAADGQVDTVAVIDMEMNPPRVVDQVVVGDAPEGLAVSPAGGYAVSLLTNGSGNVPKSAFFHHEHSIAALLRIEGKKVRKVSETEVGGLAEGIVFSPDGKYLYVANFLDSDITILRLRGNKLVPVGSLKLPGHPASMRGNTP